MVTSKTSKRTPGSRSTAGQESRECIQKVTGAGGRACDWGLNDHAHSPADNFIRKNGNRMLTAVGSVTPWVADIDDVVFCDHTW